MSEATRKMQEDVDMLRSVVSDHERRLMRAEMDITNLKPHPIPTLAARLRWLVFGK
jgi:hypothetical protein